MTPLQIFTIAMLGGLAALGGTVLAALLAAGLYTAFGHLFEWRERRHKRRHDLAECHAIHALPTHQPRNDR